jgi:hypothetical protein
MNESISDEFAGADLGDPRRVSRLQKIAEAVVSAPSAGLPSLMSGDAETEGLYRFLRNPNVSMEAILGPHFVATVGRLPEDTFVVAHDTTEFRFDGRAGLETLGRLREEGSQGFFGHFSLAISEPARRRPQGLLHLDPLFRTKKPHHRRKPDSPSNEADRWWQSVRTCATRLGEKSRHAIHVMDREADSYTLLWRLIEEGHRFVVRAAHKNRSTQSEERIADPEIATLEQSLVGVKGGCERLVHLTRRQSSGSKQRDKRHPPRQQRTAQLRFAARQLFLRRGDYVRGDVPKLLSVNVVDVQEQNPPPGCEPVRWILLTTEPIDSAASVEQIVDAYHSRWLIEEYFKALKSGCAYEKRQLKSKQTLLSALGLFAVVAWRLLVLRSLDRSQPDALATAALRPHQLQLLNEYRQIKGKPPLPEQPTVHQAMAALAELGGHLKHNGSPGWAVLGRAYESLLLMELGWQARQIAYERHM